MNTRGVYAHVMGVCVAALTVGCGTQVAGPNTGSELPAISNTTPAGYDRWQEMNGGTTDIPEMADMADAYGLGMLNWPSETYAEQQSPLGTAVGVALLEDYCVVAVHSPQEEQEQGLVNVTVMSRFNETYAAEQLELTPEDVRSMLDQHRPFCSGEASEPPTQTT